MINPENLKKKALRQYETVLQAHLTGESLFPWVVPCDKTLPQRFDAFKREIMALVQGSRDVLGYGYTIESKAAATRRFGQQDLPEQIVFETSEDLLRFIDKSEEAADFVRITAHILAVFPDLKNWLIRSPLKVFSVSEQTWQFLLEILSWYQANPRPGIYLREVPLPFSTKVLEQNKALLDSLLSVLFPVFLAAENSDFESRWGFCSKPRHFFRLRLSPEGVREFKGIAEISLSSETLQKHPLSCQRVVVIENEMSYLSFPQTSETLIIWGHGNQAAVLKELNWLKDINLYYWGDIDTHGLRILAGLRMAFPHLQALLMDRDTLERFRQWVHAGAEDLLPAPEGLNQEEQDLFAHLQRHNLRLEQEHIPIKDVLNFYPCS